MSLAPRLLSGLIGALLLAGNAQASEDNSKIHAAVKTIKDTATVRSIRDIPGLGLKEVVADSTVIYMDANGRYLFFGTLLDLESKRNLSDEAGAVVRKATLESIPDSEKIVYEPKNVKHRVYVFTDISCGYCHKVHENLQGYMDRGIAIEYLAYPRGGRQNPAFAEMQKIWCAKDRKAAYDYVQTGKSITDTPTCNDPVQKHFDIGEQLAFEGTPAIYSASGKQLGGFIAPDELAARLDKEEAPAQDQVATTRP